MLAADGAETDGALASELAAEIYGLDVLARDIEDHGHNTTRFVVMSRNAQYPAGRRRSDQDDLRLPRPQHSRRALQGDGRASRRMAST